MGFIIRLVGLLWIGLLPMALQAQTAVDSFYVTVPDTLQNDKDRAQWALETLGDEGCIIVRLSQDSLRIAAYRKAGREKMANTLEERVKEQNEALISSFIKVFTYCPVFFIEANDYRKIQKGMKQGFFLNKEGEVDTTIVLTQTFPLFCDRGVAYMPLIENSDEARTKVASSTPASNDALVLKNVALEQMQPPFPAYVPVRGKSLDRSVMVLSNRLEQRASK